MSDTPDTIPGADLAALRREFDEAFARPLMPATRDTVAVVLLRVAGT